MILCDVNVLVAAHRGDHPHHEVAAAWLDVAVNGTEALVVPDVVWSGFVRVATHPRVFAVPTPLDAALAFLRALGAAPAFTSAPSVDGLVDRFSEACRDAGATGALVPDAYLAAYATALGARLATFDRDFRRFPGLATVELTG